MHVNNEKTTLMKYQTKLVDGFCLRGVILNSVFCLLSKVNAFLRLILRTFDEEKFLRLIGDFSHHEIYHNSGRASSTRPFKIVRYCLDVNMCEIKYRLPCIKNNRTKEGKP